MNKFNNSNVFDNLGAYVSFFLLSGKDTNLIFYAAFQSPEALEQLISIQLPEFIFTIRQ